MTITKQSVAKKLAEYLQHEITLAQLVDWAETAMMDGAFSEQDMAALQAVFPRLGLADVREYGLSWDDCAQFLQKLGYVAQVNVVAV